MIFLVVLPGPVLQPHEALNQVEKVSQELHCESPIHTLDLVKHLKLVVEGEKKHLLMVYLHHLMFFLE